MDVDKNAEDEIREKIEANTKKEKRRIIKDAVKDEQMAIALVWETAQKNYELAKVPGSKTIHLMWIEKKNKPSKTVCSGGRFIKNAEFFELDVEVVTCKNCLNNQTYIDLVAASKGEPSPGRPKTADAPPTEPTVEDKNIGLKSTEQPKATVEFADEDYKKHYTLVFSATTKNQKPICTVVADGFDGAKEKIGDEQKKAGSKDRVWKRWEADGKSIISRWVPNEMIEQVLQKEEARSKTIVKQLDIRDTVKSMSQSLDKMVNVMTDFTATISKAVEAVAAIVLAVNTLGDKEKSDEPRPRGHKRAYQQATLGKPLMHVKPRKVFSRKK